jgi:hypothetical protein
MVVGWHLVGVVSSSQVGKVHGVGAVPAVATARSKLAGDRRNSQWRKNAATLGFSVHVGQ